jgi:hypothetical protein
MGESPIIEQSGLRLSAVTHDQGNTFRGDLRIGFQNGRGVGRRSNHIIVDVVYHIYCDPFGVPAPQEDPEDHGSLGI